MPTQARLDTPETLHHLIIREIEKKRIVDDVKCVRNKEVDFVSQKSFFYRLKETSVTENHWSLRGKNK
jgi:hypothetical protein